MEVYVSVLLERCFPGAVILHRVFIEFCNVSTFFSQIYERDPLLFFNFIVSSLHSLCVGFGYSCHYGPYTRYGARVVVVYYCL